jgi:hypothetical protein
VTAPDFTSPDPARRVSVGEASIDVRRRPRHRRDAVLITLLTALLTIGGFLAGFAVALGVNDRPPCTRTITQLPRPGVDERPRAAYGNPDQASAVACDVDSPDDFTPWETGRRDG